MRILMLEDTDKFHKDEVVVLTIYDGWPEKKYLAHFGYREEWLTRTQFEPTLRRITCLHEYSDRTRY